MPLQGCVYKVTSSEHGKHDPRPWHSIWGVPPFILIEVAQLLYQIDQILILKQVDFSAVLTLNLSTDLQTSLS